ncbi:winged helix-turn-helix transcriptional regulator [Rhizobium grahamii]|uniref:Winged helix-turn-helix transcriptional regulator n=1 Tax=Rhizobium grahamii TaxID=1120045 RepID=A0A5Q0C9F9_9HYPH|nr:MULTISPECIES: metalloregulator ArsR/SmtB family transcription factor [Rhizobium]QFY60309.1 winged helix-turn-helix transcriptional regulator [Rhizobium grahamii]QRM50564.1 winged helix-turn-helix transcriptional regulator [Rhizobium sp. BG6]
MTTSDTGLDRLFHALSDRSRRGMVDRLGRGPASVSELAAPQAMALPAAMKHLAVLEESGLVASRKVGRIRTYHLRKEALGNLERWLTAHKEGWNRTFDRLEEFFSRDETE